MPEIIEKPYTITEYSQIAAAMASLERKFDAVVMVLAEREKNSTEERLRSAAPLLLDALKRLRKAYIIHVFLRDQRRIDINDPILKNTNAAINAAQ